MVRTCQVTSVHKRYDTRIFQKIAVSLAKNGYDSYLLCIDGKGEEVVEGVHFVSVDYKAKNRFQRIYLSWKELRTPALKIDAEIYHIHDPELLPLAKYLSKKKKKVIFDSHEDYPSVIKEKKWIPNFLRGIFTFIFTCYEKKMCKYLFGYIACYHWTYDRIKTKVPNSTLLFNYPYKKDVIESKNTDYSSRKYVCYAGNVSEQWMHGNVLEAIAMCNDTKYLLVGSVSKSYKEKLMEISGWNKCEHKEEMPREALYDRVFSKSFAGICILDYISQCHKTIGNLSNTKLFEYMSAGIPVIATDFVLWKKIIEKYHCGICVCPTNVDSIKDAICFLRDNPSIAKEMGENGKRAVLEEFNWETDVKNLLKVYNI